MIDSPNTKQETPINEINELNNDNINNLQREGTITQVASIFQVNTDTGSDFNPSLNSVPNNQYSHLRKGALSFGNLTLEESLFSVDTSESEKKYSEMSWWLFPLSSPFRQKLIYVISLKIYNHVIHIAIVINSIFLIFDTINSWRSVSTYSNIVFTILFLCECIMKIIAYGFILDDNTYLRDPWNWWDFIVVVTGLWSFLPSISTNLLSLRTFRLIRPWKTISMMPTMRMFITTLINSMVDLSTVFLLMLLFFFIFGICGLSLYSDRSHYRCRTSTVVIDGWLPLDPDYIGNLCGGEIKCSKDPIYEGNDMCINSYNYYPKYINKTVLEQENLNSKLNYGTTNFDNIFESWFVVFLTTTTEGWGNIMNMLMDGHNYYVSFLFFAIAIIINYFFMLNLTVAVLLYNFEQSREWEVRRTEFSQWQEKDIKKLPNKAPQNTNKKDIHPNSKYVNNKKLGILRKHSTMLSDGNRDKNNSFSTQVSKSNLNSSKTSISTNINGIWAHNYNEEIVKKKYRWKYIPINASTTSSDVNDSMISFLLDMKMPPMFENIPCLSKYHKKYPFSYYCYFGYMQPISQYFFYGCILINSIWLMLDRVDMNPTENSIIEKFNIVLVGIFVFEIILNIIGTGPFKFVKDIMNIFDFVIVSVSWIEILVKQTSSQTSTNSIASIFRMLRIFRVFKLFRKWVTFQIIMESINETIKRMADYIILFLLFLYMFTWLGYSFFHNKLPKESMFNFNDFINSFISIFHTIVGDHWQDLFFDCYLSQNKGNWAITYIFFIAMWFLGHITMLNIFLSYLVHNFQRAKQFWENNWIVKNFIMNWVVFCHRNHEIQMKNSKKPQKEVKRGREEIKELNQCLNELEEKTLWLEGKFKVTGKMRIDLIRIKVLKSEQFDIITQNPTQTDFIPLHVSNQNLLKYNVLISYAGEVKTISFDRDKMFQKKINLDSKEEKRINEEIETENLFWNFNFQYDKDIPQSFIREMKATDEGIENDFDIGIAAAYEKNYRRRSLSILLNKRVWNWDKYMKIFNEKKRVNDKKLTNFCAQPMETTMINEINKIKGKAYNSNKINEDVNGEVASDINSSKDSIIPMPMIKDGNQWEDIGNLSDSVLEGITSGHYIDSNSQIGKSEKDGDINKSKERSNSQQRIKEKAENEGSVLNKSASLNSNADRQMNKKHLEFRRNQTLQNSGMNQKRLHEKNVFFNFDSNKGKKDSDDKIVKNKVEELETIQPVAQKVLFKEKALIKWTEAWEYMKNSSLFIFHRNSKLRHFARVIAYNNFFNYVIFILIIGNCFMMCFDTPWLNPDSVGKKCIFVFNYIFNVVFIIEGFLKVVSDNFIYKEKEDLTSFSTIKSILAMHKEAKSINSSTNTEITNCNLSSINNTSTRSSINASFSKMNIAEREEIINKANKISKKHPAYLMDPANIIDFICIIFSIVDMSVSKSLRYIRTLRVFRAIKPIRLLSKSHNLNIMVKCLFWSLPGIGNVMLVSGWFIFIFGWLGTSLFKTSLRYFCENWNYNYSTEECLSNGYHWFKNPYSFTNFIKSWGTNFEIMLAENWGFMMFIAGKYYKNQWVYWYYFFYILIGHLFILNWIVSVIIQQFKILKETEQQFKQWSTPEKQWIQVQKIMLRFRPKILMPVNWIDSSKIKWKVYDIITSVWFDNTIIGLILLSLLTLCMQYNGSSPGYNIMWEIFNYIFVLAFNIEMILKVYVTRKAYFYSIWNKFDFGIVVLCDLMVIINILQYTGHLSVNSLSTLPILLRSFRILRVLRLLSSFAKLRALIDTLSYWLPSIANIGIIMFLLIWIYANIGMNFFSTVPYRSVINHNINFRNFISSVILLFEVSTKENWTDMMYELAYHDCRNSTSEEYWKDFYCVNYNITCYNDSLVNYSSMKDNNMFSCGSSISYIFFISFIILGPMFIMNLCIVMVIDGFSESMTDNEGLITWEYMEKFLEVWMSYDTEGKNIIKPHEFVLMLKELMPPAGLNYDRYLTRTSVHREKEYNNLLAHQKFIKLLEETTKKISKINKKFLKVTKTCYEFEEYYWSKNKKFYTTDLEVMWWCHKFDWIPTEIKDKKRLSFWKSMKTKITKVVDDNKEDDEEEEEEEEEDNDEDKDNKEKNKKKNIENIDEEDERQYNNSNSAGVNSINKQEEEIKKVITDSQDIINDTTKNSIKNKQFYIHFIDACQALSRFAVSKMENVQFEQLRFNIVNSYTKKIWVNKYSDDKASFNNHYLENKKTHKEPVRWSIILAIKMLYKKVLKTMLVVTRKKWEDKFNLQIKEQENLKQKAMIREIGSIILNDENCINIPIEIAVKKDNWMKNKGASTNPNNNILNLFETEEDNTDILRNSPKAPRLSKEDIMFYSDLKKKNDASWNWRRMVNLDILNEQSINK